MDLEHCFSASERASEREREKARERERGIEAPHYAARAAAARTPMPTGGNPAMQASTRPRPAFLPAMPPSLYVKNAKKLDKFCERSSLSHSLTLSHTHRLLYYLILLLQGNMEAYVIACFLIRKDISLMQKVAYTLKTSLSCPCSVYSLTHAQHLTDSGLVREGSLTRSLLSRTRSLLTLY